MSDAAHPPVAEMVVAAVTALKSRKGASLVAIKKYVAANYNVDMDRIAPFIRRFLKTAVEKGTLKQTKGTGAAGSFKLGELPKKRAAKKPKTGSKKTDTPKAKTPKKQPSAKRALFKTPKKGKAVGKSKN